MDLTRPTDHKRAYGWSAVLVAHAAIGMVLATELSALLPGWQAAALASVAYLVAWEAGVQRLGAGLLDALTDAAAVTAGAVYAVAVWAPHRWAALVLFAVILAGGVWRRRRVG